MIEDKFSPFAKETLTKVVDFVEVRSPSPPCLSHAEQKECLPAEALYESQVSTDPSKRWKSIPPVLFELQEKAKKLGIWNLFLSKAHYPECVATASYRAHRAQCRRRPHQPRVRCHGRDHGPQHRPRTPGDQLCRA